MIRTSKASAERLGPCGPGWDNYLATIGHGHDAEQLVPFTEIVAAIGIVDALWTARSAPEHEAVWREFAKWCAGQARDRVGTAGDPKGRARAFVRHALVAAAGSSWEFAVWKAPQHAAEAIAWHALEHGGDFQTAKAEALEAFAQEFLRRVGD